MGDPDLMMQFLTQWNMEEVHPYLVAAEIDFESFLDIDLMTSEMLLPKHSLGYRMKLVKKIKEIPVLEVPKLSGEVDFSTLLSVTNNEDSGSGGSSELSHDTDRQQSSKGKANGQSTASTSQLISNEKDDGKTKVITPLSNSCRKSTSFEKESLDVDTDSEYNTEVEDSDSYSSDDFLINLKEKKRKKKKLNNNAKRQELEIPTKSQVEQSTNSSKRQELELSSKSQVEKSSNSSKNGKPDNSVKRQVDPTKFACAKLQATSAEEEVKNLDLQELLKSSLDGRAILNSYDVNQFLEEDERNTLVEIVTKWLLLRMLLPKPKEFIALRKKILKLFPNEVNVYYSAPREEGVHQTLARGKLFDRTKNVKEWMRRKGLMPRKKGCESEEDQTQKAVQALAENTEPTALEAAAIEWLKCKRDPWDKVEEKWSITSKHRLACLRASRACGTNGKNKPERLSSYTDKFKILRQPLGYTLLEIDFVSLFGNEKTDGLIMGWPKLRRLIISMVKENPTLINDPVGKQARKTLLKSTDEDTLNILVLQLLPSLLPPSKLVQVGKKKFKPSIKSCRDSIIAHVTAPHLVADFIEEKRANAHKDFGSNAFVQPYILLEGETN